MVSDMKTELRSKSSYVVEPALQILNLVLVNE
jgi:hypothetical protein